MARGCPPPPLEAPGVGLGGLAAEIGGRKVNVALCLTAGPDSAAALSLCLSQGGQAILLPPGPAGSEPLAPHLRGRVDEAEPRGGRVALESGPRHCFLAASYDGYAHLPDPCRWGALRCRPWSTDHCSWRVASTGLSCAARSRLTSACSWGVATSPWARGVATRLGQVVPAPVVRIQALIESNTRRTIVLALLPSA
ncbi:hypothetical protein DFAR_1430018 [Desulfarculales bacterium]